jgi:hypothetical protein
MDPGPRADARRTRAGSSRVKPPDEVWIGPDQLAEEYDGSPCLLLFVAGVALAAFLFGCALGWAIASR